MVNITPALAHKLIAAQFPQYAHLPVRDVEKQGHDNRTYRLGDDMLVRMPTAASYALKVPKEHDLLPKLAPHLRVAIPVPLSVGVASKDYPYAFSIYRWLPGKSINLLTRIEQESLAFDLAHFLKELQAIRGVDGPPPGQHNFWRGDHTGVYDAGARQQIAKLAGLIDGDKALGLWEAALKTKWSKAPVWVHGDFAIGNMLMNKGKLSAIIDFGGCALGDPACDLVIAWTFLKGTARHIFMHEMGLDKDTWLRAKAWTLWKATFELCQMPNHESPAAAAQKKIIQDVLEG